MNSQIECYDPLLSLVCNGSYVTTLPTNFWKTFANGMLAYTETSLEQKGSKQVFCQAPLSLSHLSSAQDDAPQLTVQLHRHPIFMEGVGCPKHLPLLQFLLNPWLFVKKIVNVGVWADKLTRHLGLSGVFASTSLRNGNSVACLGTARALRTSAS